MGLLWRALAPKPLKSARRTVYKTMNPLTTARQAVTPRSVYRGTHPIDAVQGSVESALVRGVRGRTSPRGRRTSARAASSAGVASGYSPTAVERYDRAQRRVQKEQEIARLERLEKDLLSKHRANFSAARKQIAPHPEPVDADKIRSRSERDCGLLALRGEHSEALQRRPEAPESVDRDGLRRKTRAQHLDNVSRLRLRQRKAAKAVADEEAEDLARQEEADRLEKFDREGKELEARQVELRALEEGVAANIRREVAATERERRARQEQVQAGLDKTWNMLLGNDATVVGESLKTAFGYGAAPVVIGFIGAHLTLGMIFPPSEKVVPERKVDWTPAGRLTLKKRTKTDQNDFFLEAMASEAVAAAKMAFAAAPGLRKVTVMVVRKDRGLHNDLEPIYAGTFDKAAINSVSSSSATPVALGAERVLLNLEGRTSEVAPVDLRERPELHPALRRATTLLR
jgi:hypothetical protein